jgi:rhomboid protease GluP
MAVVEDKIDYSKHPEWELVEMFGRMDPRYAPEECARLGRHLTALGYIVTDGGTGPGLVVPSPAKYEALFGSPPPAPVPFAVSFGQSEGALSRFEPAHNDFGLIGKGMLRTDGIQVEIVGRFAGGLRALVPRLPARAMQLQCRNIVDLESDGNAVLFAYGAPGKADSGLTLWLSDEAAAQSLVAVLPKERRRGFRPQLAARAQFERALIAQSPRTPVTLGLIGLNFLIFLATVAAGAGIFVPGGTVQVAWGSNFGPYTTDGEWWRLLTSLFIHFGVLHVVFNMWALAIFGPLLERLYGSVNFLLLYLLAGIIGSLASISWQPAVNSAGASGAILGLMGALLAAQLRTRQTFPISVVRPLRNTTLAYLGWTFYSGFTIGGIDNAAHLGGLASGFLLGYAMARPVMGNRRYGKVELTRLLQMTPLAAVLLAGGFWFAQRASTSLVGENLYYRTVRWFAVGEGKADLAFNTAARTVDDKAGVAFADRLDADVVPFWREASDRLSAVHLPSDSPNLPALKFLQAQAIGRLEGYELLSGGMRRSDNQELARAEKKLEEMNRMPSPQKSAAN